jgi:hypothetical protein
MVSKKNTQTGKGGRREGYGGFESSQSLADAVLHDCQLERAGSEVICM